MKNFPILALLLLVFLSGCTLFGEKETTYTTYTSKDFSIMYPNSWDIARETSIAFLPVEDDQFGYSDRFSVTIFYNKSLKDYEEIQKDYLLEDDKIKVRKPIQFKGRQAQLIEIENSRLEDVVKGIYFEEGNNLYALESLISKSNQDAYGPIMEKMLNSFETGKNSYSKTSTQNYKTYANDEFTLAYPNEWFIDSAKAFRFTSPQENFLDRILDEFIIEIWDDKKTFSELESLERLVMLDANVISAKQTKFKGYDSLIIESEDSTTHYKTIYIKYSNKIYRLHLAYEKSKDTKRLILEKMLDSIKLYASASSQSDITSPNSPVQPYSAPTKQNYSFHIYENPEIDASKIKIYSYYFVPKDKKPIEGYSKLLTQTLENIKTFHSSEFSNKSTIEYATPQILKGAFPSSSYRGCDDWDLWNGIMSENATISIITNQIATTKDAFPVLLIFSDTGCESGVNTCKKYFQYECSNKTLLTDECGGSGGTFVEGDIPYGLGLVSPEAWKYNVNGSEGVIYHEGVGHPLNIPHPEPLDNSVMGLAQYQCYSLNDQWINEEQKRKLTE